MNILILDDEAVSLKKLYSDLKNLGHRVLPASNTIEGLEIFTGKNNLDLVITDLRMPMGSGEDFVRDIRKLNQKIPVIVVTGTINKEVLETVKKLKCMDILVKPYDLSRLKIQLEKLA
jgi:two-component system response regulator